jgi:hypothetical protein
VATDAYAQNQPPPAAAASEAGAGGGAGGVGWWWIGDLALFGAVAMGAILRRSARPLYKLNPVDLTHKLDESARFQSTRDPIK